MFFGVDQRQGRNPRPILGGGFQRRGARPLPLCRFKGVRGEIEIPPRFSLGGWGDILFLKENIPLTYFPTGFHISRPASRSVTNSRTLA